MYIINTINQASLPLGKQGEHLARGVLFREPFAWREEFGPGSVQLLALRSMDLSAYPVMLEERADGWLWPLTETDTEKAGNGKCELQYLVGDVVVKSKTFTTVILPSLARGQPPPPPEQSYLDQVTAQGAKAAQAAQNAQEAADRAEAAAVRQPIIRDGTWWTWDPETGDYRNTGTSAVGSGSSYEIGHGLKLDDATNTLSVDTVDAVNAPEGDNTRPITAAAVNTTVGNIEVLLGTI